MLLQVWNILKFTQKKFGNYVHKTTGFAPTTTVHNAFYRHDYMAYAMGFSSDIYPDVFVILETMCDKNTALGDPFPVNSAAGVTTMLDYMKNWLGEDNWRVVPPLKCNPANVAGGQNVASEGVAVFYRHDHFELTGPWNRPAAGWPAPWDDDDITGNPAKSGQMRYYNGANEIEFPDDYHRRPFMVDLRERDGKRRTFRMLFSHTSPGFHVGGTQAIGQIPELSVNGAGQPDVFIVAGDFNVNAKNAHGATAGFQPLANIGFARFFDDRNVISTMTKKKVGSYALDPAGVFPHFPDGYLKDEVLDNFLMRYNTNYRWARKPMTGYFYDPIRGYPAAYGTTMDQPLATIAALPAQSIQTFRLWENYWHVRATSDHLSIYLEVK